MEPLKSKIKIVHVVYTKVKRVEQILGYYFVQFEGSWESLQFGVEKPFDVGATIKIIFEEKESLCPL